MARRRRTRRINEAITLRGVIIAAPLVLLAVLAFAVAVQVSVAGEFRSKAPQLALKFMPLDAEARAKLAGAVASNNPLPEARQAARALARDALRRDPISPVAVRALALARATEGSSTTDQAAAAKLFQEAERLSRRDQVTQIWLAEYYMRQDQVPQVLQHFDVALRTSSSGWDALFPLLAAASADRRVADALVERMRERPPWALPFVRHLLEGQIQPAAASYIVRSTLDPKVPDELALIRAMLQRFSAIGEYRLAQQLYDQFGLAGESGPALINDGGFDSQTGTLPFTWLFLEEADLWAAPGSLEGGNRVLMLSASSGRSGDLASQLVQLPAGKYRVAARFGNVPREAYQRPTLNVRCAEGTKAPLAMLRPPQAGSAVQQIATTFSVPGNCVFQWILVSLAGPDTQAVDQTWIDDVAITRIDG